MPARISTIQTFPGLDFAFTYPETKTVFNFELFYNS